MRSRSITSRDLIREEIALARAETSGEIAAARTVGITFASAVSAALLGATLLCIAIGGAIAYRREREYKCIMRWTLGDRSEVDDYRGRSGFGVGRGVPIGVGGLLLLVVLSWATGTNFLSLLNSPSDVPSDAVGASGRVASSPAEEREVDFVSAVMKDVQQTWSTLLPNKYSPTRIVLFRDAIDSACGLAQSVTGPFYCPQDSRVYLDLGFFQELSERFGAPGDFARAYVVAHEVGHHVQRLSGIEGRVRSAQRDDAAAANPLSVRLELQADCFAGVWGHAASRPGRAANGQVELEPGDVDEGLRAAAAIGDDRLQRATTGHVAPDRLTHGTSAQRVEWFRRGLTAGTPEACNTFAPSSH